MHITEPLENIDEKINHKKQLYSNHLETTTERLLAYSF